MIVLAGGEAPPALAAAIGHRRKAMARFGERTSLELTLDAVREADLGPCVVVTGHDVAPAVAHGTFVAEGGSAVDNALLGADALPQAEALLYLPADSPRIVASMLVRFARSVEIKRRDDAHRWYAAGITREGAFVERYPGFPTKALRLREGPYLSGALYASNREGLRHGAELFRAARRDRRSQLALVSRIGAINLPRYLLRRISIREAEAIMGRALDGQAIIVPDVDPATCLDFDTPDEYAMIRASFGLES